MRKYGFRDWDSALAAIGHGGLKEGQVVNKLLDEYNKQHQKEITDEHIMEAAEGKEKMRIAKSGNGIVVKGVHDVAVRFSKCCSPVPGDEIVGFVTRGRGLSIHRTDCINMIHLSESERARLIPAEWETEVTEKSGGQYLAEIRILAKDIAEGKASSGTVYFTVYKDGIMWCKESDCPALYCLPTQDIQIKFDEFPLNLNGREELERIVKKLQQLSGIIDIERATG